MCCENNASELIAIEKLDILENTDLLVGDLYDDSCDDAHLTFCTERSDNELVIAPAPSEQAEEWTSSTGEAIEDVEAMESDAFRLSDVEMPELVQETN